MSKVIVGEIEGPSTTSNKITIASGSQLDLVGSAGTTTLDAADITAGDLPSARLPIGTVVQVVSATKNDTNNFASTNTDTFVDLSGLSVSITPTSSSNKILIMFTVNITRSGTATQHVRLVRDTTAICVGDQEGSSRLRSSVTTRESPSGGVPYAYVLYPLSNSYLDSPGTTSATTYKLQGTLGASYAGTFYINECLSDGDNDYSPRTSSNITVMEIKA